MNCQCTLQTTQSAAWVPSRSLRGRVTSGLGSSRPSQGWGQLCAVGSASPPGAPAPSSVPKALRKTGLVSTFLWGRVFHWARLEEAGSREALGLCESWLTRTDQWLCRPALGGGVSLGEVSSTDSWAPHMHTVDPEVWSGGTVSIKEYNKSES